MEESLNSKQWINYEETKARELHYERLLSGYYQSKEYLDSMSKTKQQEKEIIGWSVQPDGTETPIPMLSAKEFDEMYTDLFYSKLRPWKKPYIEIPTYDSTMVQYLVNQYRQMQWITLRPR